MSSGISRWRQTAMSFLRRGSPYRAVPPQRGVANRRLDLAEQQEEVIVARLDPAALDEAPGQGEVPGAQRGERDARAPTAPARATGIGA